jgi:hypothetical protein
VLRLSACESGQPYRCPTMQAAQPAWSAWKRHDTRDGAQQDAENRRTTAAARALATPS